jgi:tetratricopeptide (TPR) repeat protein
MLVPLLCVLMLWPAAQAGLLERLQSAENDRAAALGLVRAEPQETLRTLEKLRDRFDASVHSMRSRPEQRRVRYDEEALRLGRWIGGLYSEATGDARPARAFAAREVRIEGTELLNDRRYREALEKLGSALAEAEQLDDAWLKVITLTNMAYGLMQVGDAIPALEACRRASHEAERLDRKARALAWLNLGSAYLHLGEIEESARHSREAAALSGEIGNRIWQGNALLNLGAAYWNLNDTRRARETFEQSLAVLKGVPDVMGVGRALAEGRTLYNLALLTAQAQSYPEAVEYMERALPLIRQIDIRHSHEIEEDERAYYNSIEEDALRLLSEAYQNMKQEKTAARYRQELEELLRSRPEGAHESHHH